MEPTLITEEFVKRLARLEKICDHFHLSLQSGCDETLKRMNRRYTTAEFEGGVQLLRRAFENATLTTDIIVGFPGETEAEFDTTYKFLEKIKFYKMHVFKYSQRKGTRAAVMPNQVDGSLKEERSRKLIALSNKNEEEYNRLYVGKSVEVLFEDAHVESGKVYRKGHTANYIVVKVETGEDWENEIKRVKIVGVDGLELLGEVASS